ncbi:MAG: hypothetical protein JKY56_02950 [Kofleriaceae bacterium]|nr:hypothetical protein [Kofleriaceae bacterium]
MRTIVVAIPSLLLMSATAHAQVSGVVLSDTGTPIADALVSVQASDVQTTSNAKGEYVLANATGTDLVIVAAAKGFYNTSVVATTPSTSVNFALDAVLSENDAGYVFKDPLVCNACHSEQYQQWNNSPMQKAGLNTWVHDIYSGTGTDNGAGGFVYLRDSPHAGANPESECASCHEPESWLNDPFSAMSDLKGAPDSLTHGVSCDICHKIADVDETKPNYPGLYPGSVTVTRPSGDPATAVMYGVLGDVDFFSANRMRASYQPQLSSAVCGVCHQDKNDPDGDGDFEEDNGVVSEPTYVEWLESDYANRDSEIFADCVDCHMLATNSADACDENKPSLNRPPGDVRSHLILGTTPEYLENAVSLTMTGSHNQATGNLEVEVAIHNDQTGHHVPSGVTIRNMILLIEAKRQGDGLNLGHDGEQVVHDLGGVGDPAQGYYAGLAGKLFGKVNHAADGTGPTFFTDATGITFDNRIPALQTDRTRVSFAVPDDGGDIEVRARLIYRRSWRALVDAKQWTEDGHGNPLADLAAPNFGHLMEEAVTVVNVTQAPASPDAGPGEPPEEPNSDGCSCRVGSGSNESDGAGTWIALLGAAAFLFFRRRRRSTF